MLGCKTPNSLEILVFPATACKSGTVLANTSHPPKKKRARKRKRAPKKLHPFTSCNCQPPTRNARNLEHGRAPTPKLRMKEHQHKSSFIHVPVFGAYCILPARIVPRSCLSQTAVLNIILDLASVLLCIPPHKCLSGVHCLVRVLWSGCSESTSSCTWNPRPVLNHLLQFQLRSLRCGSCATNFTKLHSKI